jgi:predicted permease
MGSATNYWVEGRPMPRPGEDLVADIRGVDPQYFQVMRVPLVRGAVFTQSDRGNRRVVVINQTLAQTAFAGRDPIGQHVLMPWGDTLRGEIVGVVGDIKHSGLDSMPTATIFWSMAQFPSNFMSLVVRTTADPLRVEGAIRAEVRQFDRDLPIGEVRTLNDYVSRSVAARRFNTTLLGGFATLALALASIGIYGVIAYGVSQRTREIGVRMALGARPAAVLRRIVGEGMRIVLAGVGAGVIGALMLTRLMQSLLFGISPTDPVTFGAVVVGLCSVAAVASYLPARRAARVDPVVALRTQ